VCPCDKPCGTGMRHQMNIAQVCNVQLFAFTVACVPCSPASFECLQVVAFMLQIQSLYTLCDNTPAHFVGVHLDHGEAWNLLWAIGGSKGLTRCVPCVGHAIF
jgi:hypothetical protein